ncbi:MAG: HepT-like ribonuclease domain-containing protein [Rhodoglobus sp.]
MRNFLAHDYDGSDEKVLWQAIVVEVPRILRALGIEG